MVGASKGAVPGSQVPKRRFAAALCKPGGGGGCQLLSDFRSSPQRGPLGFSRIHRAPVAQKGEDALGLVVASPGARTPSPKAFADRAGLRGPGTLFVEAVAFLLGQM